MAERLNSHRRGYDSRWKKARDTFLRQNPLCQCDECRREGRVMASEVVDHIRAPRLAEALESGDAQRIADARSLFWDSSNWQALSKRCHDSWKQRLEKSGTVAGCDASGIPLDPNHHWNRP